MIILDTTTRSLEAVLGGAITTNQLPFVACYVQHAAGSSPEYTPAANAGQSNNTTAVTLVAAPASSKQRQVKGLWIRNDDTVNATVTVQLNDNSTLRKLVAVVLKPGYTLQYTDGSGWAVLDASGGVTLLIGGSSESTWVRAQGQLPATKGTLYTCPDGKVAQVVDASYTNTDASTRTVNAYCSGGTSRRIIQKDRSMPAGDSFTFGGGKILAAGDLIEGDASAATVVDYWISIEEKPA